MNLISHTAHRVASRAAFATLGIAILTLATACTATPAVDAGNDTLVVADLEGDWVQTRTITEISGDPNPDAGYEVGNSDIRYVRLSGTDCDATSCTVDVRSTDQPKYLDSTDPADYTDTVGEYDGETLTFVFPFSNDCLNLSDGQVLVERMWDHSRAFDLAVAASSGTGASQTVDRLDGEVIETITLAEPDAPQCLDVPIPSMVTYSASLERD